MDNNFTGVVWLSTVPQMIKKASELLSLTKDRPELADTLPACTSIMLAAALDQWTKEILSNAAANYSVEHNIPINGTPYHQYISNSFRIRMVRSPGILSNWRFQLRQADPLVQALHKLIDVRNTLMHVTEEPQIFDQDNENVIMVGDEIQLTIPLPKNPWAQVSETDAQTYKLAVEIYITEVHGRYNEEMKPGVLITRT